jgi:hypothetical protein
MTLPFSLRVLRAVTDTIKSVTPENGYVFDLSDYEEGGRIRERVFRGRDIFGSNDPLPMVAVLEHPRALARLMGGEGSTASVGQWELLIQGFVKDDRDHPTDNAHQLAAEVVQALASAKEAYNVLGLGDSTPCVTDMDIKRPVSRPPDGDISSVAFFFLEVTLTLSEDLENPFA